MKNRIKKLKKWYTISLSILIIVALLAIFSANIKNNVGNDIYNFTRIWVTFNGKTANDMVAVTSFNRSAENIYGESNEEFLEFVRQDISQMRIEKVKKIEIAFSHFIDDAEITIGYEEGVAIYEKNITVHKLIDIFMSKWYILGAGLFGRTGKRSGSIPDGIEVFEPIELLKSDSGVSVDSKVARELNNKDEVFVEVMLEDYSGLEYNPDFSESERARVLKEKMDYFSSFRKEFISEFSSSEMKVKEKFIIINGFSAIITKPGFDKLVKDRRVISILSVPRFGRRSLTQTVPLINATLVWDINSTGSNITGKDVTVCVIDSGVNYSHPDLGGCFGTDCKIINGTDFYHDDNDPYDTYGHGTMVTGIIAANGGLKGVAPETKIIAIQDGDEDPVYENIRKGVEWCVVNKTEFNISAIVIASELDYSSDENCFPELSLSAALKTAFDNGIFIVGSSGNMYYTDRIGYPSCANGSTSVSSTDNLDRISDFGNRCNILDMVAPGDCVNTTNATNSYDYGCGTSFSAPHVAGAVALLTQFEKEKYDKTMTPKEIDDRFKDTGKLIFDDTTNLTFPRIDVYSALFPIDVQDFERVYASNTRNVFFFKIKNNFNNKTKVVNWSFDIGNGTVVTSQYDTTLSPKEDVFVFFEENYSDGDVYDVQVTAASGSDSDTEEMTLTLGDIIAHDVKEIYSDGFNRVFSFKILNNMDSPQVVNWTFYTDDSGEEISADKLTLLQPDEGIWVYFEKNYTSSGSYHVKAKAFNVNSTDYTETIQVNVPS